MDSGGGVKLESNNLRDLLRLKEEEQHGSFNQSTSSNGSGGSGLTLLAILTENRGAPPRPPESEPLQGVQSSRTLLDIIREDQIDGSRRDGGRRWRNLTGKICLRHGGTCGGSGWPSTVTVDDNSRRSARFDSNAQLRESSQSELNVTVPIPRSANGRFDVPTRRSVSEEGGGGSEQPARASLMELLAENDFLVGFGSSSYTMVEDDDDEEEILVVVDEIEAAGFGSVEYNNCCVCMVRHKGAAFIPCGHTFCRLCSRELWVQRGNCPLCNNYISQVLDIF